MPEFTLRITITGLIAIASIDDETRLLFPRTTNIQHQHQPLLFYDQKYLSPPGTAGTFDHCSLDGKEIDWTNVSDDPPRHFTPDAALNLSVIEHNTKYWRQAAQGDGNGNLVARICLHAGGLTCCEAGHYFTVPPSTDQHEAGWVLQWEVAVDGTSLPIETAPLKDSSNKTKIQELFPVGEVIEVVFAHVPNKAIPAGGTSDHYQAIYDLLRSGLKVPHFAANNPSANNKHCDYHLPVFEGRTFVTEAFQCYPSIASLS